MLSVEPWLNGLVQLNVPPLVNTVKIDVRRVCVESSEFAESLLFLPAVVAWEKDEVMRSILIV